MKQLVIILLALVTVTGIAACADAQTPKQKAPVAAAPPATHTRHVTAKDPNRSNRCEATTKKGARCKRDAKPGSHYCAQHQAYKAKG